MDAADFDYPLPEDLIAAHPAAERDASRLMVVPREGGQPLHRHFRDLVEFLRPGDLLVHNDSKVMPARFFGQRLPGGGVCEVLLLHPEAPDPASGAARWSALVRPGKKIRPGMSLRLAEDLTVEVEAARDGGERVLRFPPGVDAHGAMERHGAIPLPPYILAARGTPQAVAEDRERYQTVYARPEGSVAAPTAGLHFTEELLRSLEAKGVERASVTLHVGAGTFQGMADGPISAHQMHNEWCHVPPETADAVRGAKAEGRCVIAVGTTTARTLESAAQGDGSLRSGSFETRLMIAPGYPIRVVDGLITNFHLPRSTLLCLVAAFLGRERLFALYREAVESRYRFYSYGDAMLILPPGRGAGIDTMTQRGEASKEIKPFPSSQGPA